MRTYIPIIDLRHVRRSELPNRSCWACKRSQAGDALVCKETGLETDPATAQKCIAFDDIRLRKARR